MNDLAATAQRLRDVKEATRSFLTLWSLEEMRQRVHRGEELAAETVEEMIDTAAVEAAILELDVYGSESLIRGVLTENRDGDDFPASSKTGTGTVFSFDEKTAGFSVR